MLRVLAFVVASSMLAAGSAFAAEAKVTVEKTHLCCTACVKGAEKAVTSVAGAVAECDRAAGSVTITAPDAATAQKAVDALVAAGYYGKATGAEIKDTSGAPAGQVKAATVSGFHNCCKKCTTSINEVIAKVPGAKGEVEGKATTVKVTGDFDAKKLVDAFNEAGFSVKVAGK
jgi:periplasmic mercuric ion binding protein